MSAVNWILNTLATWSSFLLLAVATLSAVVAFAAQRKQAIQEQDIKGWLTGGDSWTYYEPNWTKERKLAFFVRHVGQYPAYDVVLRVQDEEAERTPGDPIYIAPAILKDRGFDWAEPSALIFSEKPTRGEARRLKLEISMRSGTVVVQRIQFYDSDGRWHTRSKDITKNGSA